MLPLICWATFVRDDVRRCSPADGSCQVAFGVYVQSTNTFALIFVWAGRLRMNVTLDFDSTLGYPGEGPEGPAMDTSTTQQLPGASSAPNIHPNESLRGDKASPAHTMSCAASSQNAMLQASPAHTMSCAASSQNAMLQASPAHTMSVAASSQNAMLQASAAPTMSCGGTPSQLPNASADTPQQGPRVAWDEKPDARVSIPQQDPGVAKDFLRDASRAIDDAPTPADLDSDRCSAARPSSSSACSEQVEDKIVRLAPATEEAHKGQSIIKAQRSMNPAMDESDIQASALIGLGAAERLQHMKWQGRLRLLRLRVPTMSMALIIGCGSLPLSWSLKSSWLQCFAIVPTYWAGIIFALGVLPSDPPRFFRSTIVLILIPALLYNSVNVLAEGLELSSKGAEQCSYKDRPAPCWQMTQLAVCKFWFALSLFVGGVWFALLLCRTRSTSKLHDKSMLTYGVLNLIWATPCTVDCLAFIISKRYLDAISAAILVLSHFVLSILCLHGGFVPRFQAWLMSRGESAAAAAGVAELLGGWTPEKVLAQARRSFLCVSADQLLQDDMADNKPNSALCRLTQQGHLGKVDAFVSHSWHDSAEVKWAVLQKWREDFKKQHQGVEPTLWIDKYCIDQNNIEESLACLPVFLAGCQKLLILCGKTYLQRLWCLVEIMVFLEMGGDPSNLEMKLLADIDLDTFDPKAAECFTDHDTKRLRGVLEITGYDCIKQLVRDTFVDV